MKNLAILFLIALIALIPLFGQQEKPKPIGVLASLKVDQPISLKDVGDRYLITVIEGDLKLPQSHKVVEVGADFVVAVDITGLNVTRIPLTSIKAVVQFKGLGKK